MNRDPILIRVDGTLRTGWESFSRCLTIAAALQRRRRPTYFLSQLEPNGLALGIKRGGNDWVAADSPVGTPDDLRQTLKQIARLNPAAVIVDSTEASEDYLRELAGAGPRVVSIDHAAAIRFPSRLIINPLLGPGREAYEFGGGTQVLLGERFALVRPEVRRARPIRSQEPPHPYRALVALGDDDPNMQSGELAKQLLNMPRVERVDIVVRPQHPGLEQLRALAEACPDRLEVATEPPEVTARLSRCHFALTAGNAWSLELACVGIPQLLIVQAEAHWPTAQRLEEEGAATCLGWHESVSPGTLRQAVQELLGDTLTRQSMARCGRKLIDARGTDRIVTGLEVVLHNVPPTPALADSLAA